MGDDEFKHILPSAPNTTDYGSKNNSSIRGGGDSPPPPYERIPTESNYSQQFGTTSGRGTEPNFNNSFQEAYTPGNGHYITCRVCQAEIDIIGKRDQFVVKCQKCNEATPIQNPPAGKKYVRCPCNCLLVCKISSQRIACPRMNCKRIINLGTTPITPPVSSVSNNNPNMQRVTCIHCNESFLFDLSTKALAKCPHCRRVSSVGTYAPIKGLFYLILGVILLGICVFVILCTKMYADQYPGYYALYLACCTVILWVFWKSRFYFCVKVSSIDVV